LNNSNKIVIFDLDGVLFRNYLGLARQVRKFVSKKTHHKVDSCEEKKIATRMLSVVGGKANIFYPLRLIYRLGREIGLGPIQSIEFLYFGIQLSKTPRYDPTPVGGIDNLFTNLEERGYQIGVVSDCSRRRFEHLLSKHEFLRRVPYVVTRNDVWRVKPSPEGLQRIIDASRANAKLSYYVDDVPNMIPVARGMGLRTIGVLGDLKQYTLDAFIECSPDHLVDWATEISDLI